MCECCPGCALQLFCWKFLDMYELLLEVPKQQICMKCSYSASDQF